MANVKEIFYRTPPSVLYHYTKQQGLLGIIGDKEIWASHTQYLNDVREFRHALDLVREELWAMMKAQTPAREDVFKCLAEMKEAMISGMEGINVCVCWFSEGVNGGSKYDFYKEGKLRAFSSDGVFGNHRFGLTQV